MDKLSRLQKKILGDLLAWPKEGVRLDSLRRPHPSRSDSAAFSRALRRLEARGLLVRKTYYPRPPGTGHTASLVLTNAGRRVAKRVNTAPVCEVNRLSRGEPDAGDELDEAAYRERLIHKEWSPKLPSMLREVIRECREDRVRIGLAVLCVNSDMCRKVLEHPRHRSLVDAPDRVLPILKAITRQAKKGRILADLGTLRALADKLEKELRN
jgi:hypothetical protein